MNREFCIDGEDFAAEPWEYRLAGLDGIVLLNGFTRRETDYGPAVAIDNVDGLHEAIALHIISTRKMLTPQEFRFLRRELDLTQNQLGQRLGVDGQTVARYEKGASRISGPADKLIRLLFVLDLLPEEERAELMERIQEAMDRDESKHARAQFAETNGEWHEVRAT